MVKLCQFFKTTPPRVFREKGNRYLAGVNSMVDFPSVTPLKQNPNSDPSLCSPMILNSTLQAKGGPDMAVNAVELGDQFCGGLWMGVERCWLYLLCWTVGCNDSNQSNSMYFSVTCTFMSTSVLENDKENVVYRSADSKCPSLEWERSYHFNYC